MDDTTWEDEVVLTVSGIKLSKAVGINEITPELIKHGGENMVKIL